MQHEIQVALQGGGAKLSALLAALEALKQRGADFKPTRMAGTSAGAVGACIFAAGCDIADVRRYCLEHRTEFLEAFRTPGMMRAGYVLFCGNSKPLWSDAPFRQMLQHFMGQQGCVTFDDLKSKSGIDVTVVSADLENARPTFHTGEDRIVKSVLDSCGLPYLFKVGDPVDGGLCENLPIERLLADREKHGPVVAISFRKSKPKTPSGIIGFTLALVDTALTNSVERSKALLPKPFVHEIETSITTFDFHKALDPTIGLGADYDAVRQRAHDFLTNLKTQLDQNQGMPPPHWETTDPSAVLVMENAFRAYKILEDGESPEFLANSFEVTANCLFDDQRRGLDAIRHSSVFRVHHGQVSCLAAGIGAPPGTPYLGFSDWAVYSGLTMVRSKAQIVAVPVRDPSKPRVRRFAFYFKPLPSQEEPYRFVFRDRGDRYMRDTLEGRPDSVGFTCGRKGVVGRIDVILHVPERYRALAVSGGSGARLSSEDIDNDYERPGECMSYGWRATNVPSGHRVFMNLE